MTKLDSISPDIEQLQRYRRDHWSFLSDCVYTLDQADKYNPVKKYPSDKEYLHYISNLIIEENLLALVKHRRMVVTWTVCALWLWDCIFHEGRLNVLLSKKEEDSDDLVRRCKFIYDNIPKSVLRIKPSANYKYTVLEFPEIDSRIKGFAQGADQLRQYTCSRIGADEMAFWPMARATFVAMKPTLEGGGKVTLFSTRYPGFFKELIEDTLDN